MKLIDLLKTVSPDTLIGIWNIDDKREKCPTPQTYQKARNIPWNKMMDIVDYEVLCFEINYKNGGLLVLIYDKDGLQMRKKELRTQLAFYKLNNALREQSAEEFEEVSTIPI